MKKILYYLEKYKIIVGISFVIIFILIGTILFISNNKEKSVKVETPIKQEKNVKEDKVKIDIKGMVNNPGVYELIEGERVWDCIKKAGGLKEGANTEYINLSKRIKDEMVIIIYSSDDVDKFKEEKENTIYIKYECECPDNINDACITDKDEVNTNGVKNKDTENKSNEEIEGKTSNVIENIENESDGLVSINNGTKEELMTLSGIGESKAKAIIEYRNKNGNFEKLEDIMNVSGIGNAAYSKIKDSIKL